MLAKLAENELVEPVFHPGFGTVSAGESGPFEWLEGPPLAVVIGNAVSCIPEGGGFCGPGCAAGDPDFEVSDGFVGQLSLGGHFEFLVFERRDQAALIRFARDDGRAFFATLENGGAGVESQVAFLLIRAVALEALTYQDWADLLFKMVACCGAVVGSWRGGPQWRSEQR